jgi:hypothetical protein
VTWVFGFSLSCTYLFVGSIRRLFSVLLLVFFIVCFVVLVLL